MINRHVGHPSQLGGVEELEVLNGKGRGMRIYEVRTESGLFLTLSPDRALDILRLNSDGINLSYFSPVGYVAPEYFDKTGDNFLRSFTAGFLTTCGLENVGSPNLDNGETLGLHGSIANTPSEYSYYEETDDSYLLHARVRDEVIFGRKLILDRLIEVKKREKEFVIQDRITNEGDRVEPLEILYHMNMGYPLLDEDSVLTIPSFSVLPRDKHAEEDIENWMHMEEPTPHYQERCYYHQFDKKEGKATIYQPKLNKGLEISFDTSSLDSFVEWKMMGERDYVLGLECGNAYPDGRDVMRRKGILKFIKPGEEREYKVKVKIIER